MTTLNDDRMKDLKTGKMRAKTVAVLVFCAIASAHASDYDGHWRGISIHTSNCGGVSIDITLAGSTISGSARSSSLENDIYGSVGPDGFFMFSARNGDDATTGRFAGKDMSGHMQLVCGRVDIVGTRVE